MAPQFWIHCNLCVAKFSKHTQLFLLSCEHILCRQCMSNKSDKGKKCPICEASIRYMELTKLTDNLKNYFKPDAGRLINEPLKFMEFQSKQMKIYYDHMRSMNKQYKIMTQKAAQKKLEVERLEQQYLKQREIRIKMQQKLKEIWTKEGRFNSPQPQAYRNPRDSTLSSTSSPASSATISSKFTTPDNRSGFFAPPSTASSKGSVVGSFFDRDAPMLKSQSEQNKKPQCKKKNPLFA